MNLTILNSDIDPFLLTQLLEYGISINHEFLNDRGFLSNHEWSISSNKAKLSIGGCKSPIHAIAALAMALQENAPDSKCNIIKRPGGFIVDFIRDSGSFRVCVHGKKWNEGDAFEESGGKACAACCRAEDSRLHA